MLYKKLVSILVASVSLTSMLAIAKSNRTKINTSQQLKSTEGKIREFDETENIMSLFNGVENLELTFNNQKLISDLDSNISSLQIQVTKSLFCDLTPSDKNKKNRKVSLGEKSNWMSSNIENISSSTVENYKMNAVLKSKKGSEFYLKCEKQEIGYDGNIIMREINYSLVESEKKKCIEGGGEVINEDLNFARSGTKGPDHIATINPYRFLTCRYNNGYNFKSLQNAFAREGIIFKAKTKLPKLPKVDIKPVILSESAVDGQAT